MRRIYKAAAAAAALFFVFVIAASAAFAETGEDSSVTDLVITLDTQYGRCRFEWEGPEGMEYEATLQAVDADGSVMDLISDHCFYSYLQGDDYVAYCCQEYGVPHRMRIRVTGKTGDEVTAEGYSEEFDPADFWPDKEGLRFGEDIPMEDITWVSWTSSGDYAEANWNYTAYANDGKPRVSFRRAGRGEKEIRISAARWNRLLSLISEGRMEIRYVGDPTVVMLDGVDEGMDVSWEDRYDDHRLSYYGFLCDSGTHDKIEKWFASTVQWSLYGWKLYTVIAACAVLLISAVLFFRKGAR